VSRVQVLSPSPKFTHLDLKTALFDKNSKMADLFDFGVCFTTDFPKNHFFKIKEKLFKWRYSPRWRFSTFYFQKIGYNGKKSRPKNKSKMAAKTKKTSFEIVSYENTTETPPSRPGRKWRI
jgi:hypothetical protein